MQQSNSNAGETADRLNRRRARMLLALAVFVLAQQASFFMSGEGARTVDMVRNAAWVVLAAVILTMLVTGGSWFRSREVRRLMNDEVTEANRASALKLGFTVATASGIALFALEVIAPGSATTREAIHIVVSFGLVAALLRFGFHERRALG